MPSDRTISAVLSSAAPAVGLILFGVFFNSVVVAAEGWLPRDIYFEKSFTLALIRQMPLALASALASGSFVLWLLIPAGRGRLRWQQIDRVGGLRWPVFAVVAAFTWSYAGHPYNYLFDQSHTLDRWLLVLLMFCTLRSPLLIPIFVLELLVSRSQFQHPISSVLPGVDELPMKVLGIVVGCGLWNGLLGGLQSSRSGEGTKSLQRWFRATRIETHSLIYSILCLIASFYAFAGLNKLLIGENLTDWVRFSHMENLFVASHFYGWLSHLSETRVLELAGFVRAASVPLSAATLALELSMFLILLRQRGTLLLFGAITLMHLGIVCLSGIFFWKWMVLDLAFLVWLWLRREDSEIRRMYSTSGFVVSLLIIAATAAVFGGNPFTWWNTKWITFYEIQVLDQAGNTYVVDPADFSPYTLFDIHPTEGRRIPTHLYAGSHDFALMQELEVATPFDLRNLITEPREDQTDPAERRKERLLGNFMIRYFRNRNEGHGPVVPPFHPSPPPVHNRHLSAPNLYRDQAPVVEIRLRYLEIYYSGSALHRMRDEIVHRIRLRRPGAKTKGSLDRDQPAEGHTVSVPRP